MTCRHMAGDPDCSSYPAYRERMMKTLVEEGVTPDKKRFKIVSIDPIDATWDGVGLVLLTVNYPNCASCAFEGTKLLVVRTSLNRIHTWSEIDPHFSNATRGVACCPSPIARFPADGKAMAMQFARMVANVKS